MSLNSTPTNLNVTFALEAEGRNIHLGLSLNDNIFSQPIFVNYLRSDGTVRLVESVPAGRHLAYLGRAFLAQENGRRQESAGWARMSIYNKNGVNLLEGAFSIDGIEYHVQPDYNYRSTILAGEPALPAAEKPYSIVWRDGQELGRRHGQQRKRQSVGNSTQCSFDNLDYNRAQMASIQHELGLNGGLEARQHGYADPLNLVNTIGSTEGCSNSRKIALLGIATDCTYTAQFDSTDDLRQHVLAQINTASQVFEQGFNISLRVRNLTISDRSCPSRPTTSAPWNRPCGSLDISERLDKFSQWRSENGGRENAAWTLLSTCNSGSTIGLAWMGTVCRHGSDSRGGRQSPPSTNVVVRTRHEWQVIAHEIGHNFGAVHDCTESCGAEERCCPFSADGCDAGGTYIMNPGLHGSMSMFSPCTTGNVCTLMGRNLIRTDCLRDNGDEPTISDDDADDDSSTSDSWIDRNRAVFILLCVLGGIIALVATLGCATMLWRKARVNRRPPQCKEVSRPTSVASGWRVADRTDGAPQVSHSAPGHAFPYA